MTAGASLLVTVLQHLPHEGPALAGEVLRARGHTVRTVRLWEGQPCPSEPGEVGALLVLGGDMDTDEKARYPFLAEEVALLARCAEAGTHVLALCLGAQLLAEATGGSVSHGTPEIGYPPIRRTTAGAADAVLGAFEDGTRMFSAHRDYIGLDGGASVLATSERAPVQAFRVGNALGLQFHPEVDAGAVATYVALPETRAYLEGAGWTGDDLLAQALRHETEQRAAGIRLLARWLEVALVHRAAAARPDSGPARP